MAKKKNRRQENDTVKERALNPHLWIFGALAVFFCTFGIAVLTVGATVLGIVLLLVAGIGAFLFVISPVYYLFGKRGVTIVYLLGDREVIPWGSVRSITAGGSYISKYDALPHFTVAYPHTGGRFYMRGEIAKTRKTRRLLEKYYRGQLL